MVKKRERMLAHVVGFRSQTDPAPVPYRPGAALTVIRQRDEASGAKSCYLGNLAHLKRANLEL